MSRQVDGSVLCDSQLEQAFYASTKMGGFWRGFRAPQWQKKANDFLLNWQTDAGFSYSQLSQAFQLWMIANLISKGEGRNQINLKQRYELTWLQSQDAVKISKANKHHPWESLNSLLKQCFFYLLEKLKVQLSTAPEQAFDSWENYNQSSHQDKNNTNKLLEKQYKEAPQALYNYSIIGRQHDRHAVYWR